MGTKGATHTHNMDDDDNNSMDQDVDEGLAGQDQGKVHDKLEGALDDAGEATPKPILARRDGWKRHAPLKRMQPDNAEMNVETGSTNTSGAQLSEFEQTLREMKEERDEMIANTAKRDAEKQEEFKVFQQQCRNETANLLKHVGEIQALIATNEAAHLRRIELIEAANKARDERMEATAAAANARADAAAAATNAKFDQLMATILATQSAKCTPTSP